MSTIFRYAKHLKRLNVVGWRVVLNQPHLRVSGGMSGFHQTLPLHSNLTKGYATKAAVNSQLLNGHTDEPIQNLEVRLKRSGRLSKSDIEKTLAELQSIGTLTSIDALFLIRSCGRPLFEASNEESINLAQEIWDTCEQLRVPMDVSHYNTLLNVYLEKDYTFSPSSFYDTMLEKSIEPNRVTYQKLIAAYCKSGDITGATKMLEMMKDKNLPLCENIFNSLITGHARANDLESAVGILKTMQSAKIDPSSDTYEALLCAYAKYGDMEAIRSTLDEMGKSDIYLIDAQLLEIVYTLAVNGHVAAAETFIDERVKQMNQDSDVGRILTKLVYAQQIPLALKLCDVTSSTQTRQLIRSLFIIRSAVRNRKIAVDDVTQICKRLESSGYNPNSFQLAIFHSFTTHCDPKFIIPLLKSWRENGGEIRCHYFWPLLRSYSKENDYDGLINVIRTMVEDFELTPCIETLRDYVIPFMFDSWQDAVDVLGAENIPKKNIYFAIVDRLLFEKKLRNCGMFMTKYPMRYPKEMFLHPLVTAFAVRNDTHTFLSALRLLEREPDASDDVGTPLELMDDAVSNLLNVLPNYRYRLVIQLLDGMMKYGLSISPEVGDQIRLFLQDRATPEIENLITKLTSRTLTEVPLSQSNPYIYAHKVDEFDSMTNNELRELFQHYFLQKDPRKIRDILKKMEAANFTSPPILAQALDVFCDCGDLEAAEGHVNKIKNLGTMKLDQTKIIKYATLLVRKNRFNDAIEFISEQPEASDQQKLSRVLKMEIEKLFDTLVKADNVENLFQMFNILRSKNLIETDIYSLGPLVKLHIERNDMESALKAFELACINYNCLPYKNVLLKIFVENEDANSLQKLTDLITEKFGETVALSDLAFTFVECDRPRQAQKVFETSGIQIQNRILSSAIDRLMKHRDISYLEKLPRIMRCVTRIDHGFLYKTLLNVYDSKNDWERGLALWTDMQEHDIQPSREFLDTLGSLLERNNQKVPFVYHKGNYIGNVSNTLSAIATRTSPKIRHVIRYNQRFDEALLRQDYDLAEREIHVNSVSTREKCGMYGRLVKAMVQNDNIDGALDKMKQSLVLYSRANRRVFRFLCEKLIDADRFSDIVALGDLIGEPMKFELHYYKIQALGYIKRHGVENYLENLKIDTNDSFPRQFESKVHFGSLVKGLIDNPSVVPLMEKKAQEMLEAGIERGMHVLWNYHVIINSPKAEDLWKTYISNSPSPLILPICDFAKEKRDAQLIEQVNKKIQKNPNIALNIKANLMSTLISIHNTCGNYHDALRILHNVLQRFSIDLIPRAEVLKLKENIEKSGRTFPYKIEGDQRIADSKVYPRRYQSAKI